MSLQIHNQGQADGNQRLPPPPRTIPPALARYLRAGTLNIPLTIIGFGLIAFWGECGFGADVASLLFLSARSPAAGTVTRFEATGTRETTGFISPTPHAVVSDVPSVPIYAVYFTYAFPPGSRHPAVCYALGSQNNPNVPFAGGVGDEADLPLTPGTPIAVETVGQGRFARIRGTRTNLYDIHSLIILVFPGFGLFLFFQARRYLRRALRLLAAGHQDKMGGQIVDPADASDAARSISLTDFPFNRVTARDGALQAPTGSILKLWIAPLLALGCNIWYIAVNAREIFYPIKALVGLGR